VSDGEKIHNVLVTIIDETETRELQHQFKEAERKNQEEMEQLLAILRVDPSLLNEFLLQTSVSLNNISEKFEKNKDKDFKALINYVFRNIHNLKGNALLIEMDLFVNKFEKIENLITEIKNQPGIIGDDFLKILFEVNEVDQTIQNMHSLISRVATLSERLKEQDSDNKLLLKTIEKATNRISLELDKKAAFYFENPDGVRIPRKYKIPFKDIIVQLVRNSISHGIEEPKERENQGKSEEGRLSVKLSSTKDLFVFKYRDDGKGIDVEKIKRKAIEKKLISEEDAVEINALGIVRMLFKDGFTTKETADSFSGRGEGLSLISHIVQKHKGKVKMSFSKGKFFQMTVELPKIA
jgi:chemotaxis protein histidine kinase CheA